MDPVLGQQQAMYNPYGSIPTLPAGWVEHRTPTGQPYWFNTLSGQSSWVYPVMPVATPAPKKKKQIKKKIPGTQWLFVTTHDGYEFYYDRETKTSVWEMPEELKEPMEELKRLEEEKEKEEAESKKMKEEQDKKRALEEEEQQLEAKRVKLEEEIVEQAQDTTDTKEQELDATEMTEEDIMWQLQQMEGSEEEEQEQEEPEEQVVIEEEEPVEEAAPVEKKIELTEEERIAQFNELLQERHISPFAMYSTEYPELMNDPRFSLVPPNKQKSLFNKYCHDLGEKMKNEKKNKKKPEDEFKELLEQQVTKKMYWDDFRRKYKDDPRFKAMKITKEKEALFKEHVKYNLNKLTDPTEAYLNLLKETKEITKGIRWRDAKKILEVDDRYYLLDDKDKREDIFRDYLETI